MIPVWFQAGLVFFLHCFACIWVRGSCIGQPKCLGCCNFTSQHWRDTISIHDYQRWKRNCLTLVIWIDLFPNSFEGRYEAITCKAGILSFAITLPYFYLSLEISCPQENQKSCKMKRKLSIAAEMASYLTVSGDVALLINSAFNVFRVTCPGEVGREQVISPDAIKWWFMAYYLFSDIYLEF